MKNSSYTNLSVETLPKLLCITLLLNLIQSAVLDPIYFSSIRDNYSNNSSISNQIKLEPIPEDDHQMYYQIISQPNISTMIQVKPSIAQMPNWNQNNNENCFQSQNSFQSSGCQPLSTVNFNENQPKQASTLTNINTTGISLFELAFPSPQNIQPIKQLIQPTQITNTLKNPQNLSKISKNQNIENSQVQPNINIEHLNQNIDQEKSLKNQKIFPQTVRSDNFKNNQIMTDSNNNTVMTEAQMQALKEKLLGIGDKTQQKTENIVTNTFGTQINTTHQNNADFIDTTTKFGSQLPPLPLFPTYSYPRQIVSPQINTAYFNNLRSSLIQNFKIPNI